MMKLFMPLDSALEEFQNMISSPTMPTETVLMLAGIATGAVVVVVAAWRDYFRRLRATPKGLSLGNISPAEPAQVKIAAPPAPAPASPPPAVSSPAPRVTPTFSPRSMAPSGRHGSSYVRRAPPKRSTATRNKTEGQN